MKPSFRWALAGFRKAVLFERSLRIQLCCAGYVIAFGALAGLEDWAWAACLICIGMVLCAEMLNTALERLCDRVCPENDALIRLCKDAAAGGVFMAAALSAVVGSLIFFRPNALERLWEQLTVRPWLAAVLAALLVPCVFFVKGSPKGVKDRVWESKNRA